MVERHHLQMGRHADGIVARIEGDEVGFEHDVAIDLERGRDRLQAAETGCSALASTFEDSRTGRGEGNILVPL